MNRKQRAFAKIAKAYGLKFQPSAYPDYSFGAVSFGNSGYVIANESEADAFVQGLKLCTKATIARMSVIVGGR